MIKSMTGFGKKNVTIESKTITIEIRTLNSKQLDLNMRISSLFRDKENEIRTIIAQQLERGKIDVAIYLDKSTSLNTTIDFELAKLYYEKIKELSNYVQNPISSDIFIQTLRMPDVISSPKEELDENTWTELKKNIEETCLQVNDFRISEGNILSHDLISRVNRIADLINEIIPFENERMILVRKRMMESLENAQLTGKYDQNRFEQELIYYIEKLDITEEKVRLKKHCDYFLETIQEENSQGKKLGFIVQEIGREVNTIGSKCNHFNIQQIVVGMKDEVEKLKEQLANIV
ncbi:MAG: YicC/YloC family endoribonuclease [Bacteroidales bacterium]|nr:YicC/YloC family endoribonuclease [Bacteroidales bacterium]